MTLPNCFPILNPDYFTNLLLSVNAAATEAELQALVNQVYADISILQSTITSQLSFMAPIAAVLTPPTGNFGSIVAWATNMVAVLTQLYKPFAVLTAQLAAIAGEVATLSAAIASVAAVKGFIITIPPIASSCVLP